MPASKSTTQRHWLGPNRCAPAANDAAQMLQSHPFHPSTSQPAQKTALHCSVRVTTSAHMTQHHWLLIFAARQLIQDQPLNPNTWYTAASRWKYLAAHA
jgi:hypothetical protein